MQIRLKDSKAIRFFILLGIMPAFLSVRVVADGGMFVKKYEITPVHAPASPDQRAIILFDQGRETLIVQDKVQYTGDTSDLAWIVPVPSRPAQADIQTASDTVFLALENLTMPRIYYERVVFSPGAGGSGCGCGGAGGGAPAGAGSNLASPVSVWDQMTVGPYDVTVLSTEQSDSLVEWLGDNGYDIPSGAASVIDKYVQKQWYFVAAKVTSAGAGQDTSSSSKIALPPLQITFDTDTMVFPLEISQINTVENSEILIYAITNYRVRSSNFNTVSLDKLALSIAVSAAGPDFDYNGYIQQESRAGDQAAFVVEYANTGISSGQFPNSALASDKTYFLTRLRAFMDADDMADDVVLEQDPSGDTELQINITIAESPPRSTKPERALAALLLVFGVPLLFASSVGPKRRSRLWLAGLFMAMILI